MADRVLVVDDEQSLRKILAATLQREGYEVEVASDGEEALAALDRDGADVVVTDLVMPKMDGLSLLRKVVVSHPDVPVIVVTAHGHVERAVERMKAGAFDFVTKPFEHAELKTIIAKAARQSDLNARNVIPDEPGRRFTEIVGKGQRMVELQRIIAKVEGAPSTVLIQGESGTGKELVATALHETSVRRDRPFIKINCAAIPRELVEAELFGFEKGAFTGAVQSKPGRFELADGGTLFLDEIGEIPLEMQVKLLRAIQESEFERVGGVKTTRVEVRLIAATSRDLGKEIAAGRFREDLYYRLNVVPVQLPPLRERREDIPLLVEHFRQKYNARLKKNVERIEDDALAALSGYSWPGNIRELENVLERTILFAERPVIRAADLPPSLRATPVSPEDLAAAASPGVPAGPGSLKEIVKEQVQAIERDLIVRGLEVTNGNVTRTAKLLKISRKSLQMKMKEFGLRGEVCERLCEPLRRFVEDELGTQRPQLRQHLRTVGGFPGQETGEMEPSFGIAGRADRRDRGARPRHWYHGDALLHRAPHENGSRIAHGRRSCIGDERERFAVQQAMHQGLHARPLVEGGQRVKRLLDTEVFQQISRMASVLGDHRVTGGEHFTSALGDVRQVPDRRRDHEQPPPRPPHRRRP